MKEKLKNKIFLIKILNKIHYPLMNISMIMNKEWQKILKKSQNNN